MRGRNPGPPPFSSINSTPAPERSQLEYPWRRTLFSSCASWFAESHALAGPVLFREIDASSFEGMPYRGFVGVRNRNFAINDFDPTDRCHAHLRCGGQVKGRPSQHGTSRTHLSACNFFCHGLLIFMIQYDVIYIVEP